MARLAAYVHVTDPEHGTAAFGPDDEVPAWAEKHITNPKAWADPPAPQAVDDDPDTEDEGDGDTPPAPPADPEKPPYGQWKVDQLREEISRRNDIRDADHIRVDEPGNKAELVAALQADDTK